MGPSCLTGLAHDLFDERLVDPPREVVAHPAAVLVTPDEGPMLAVAGDEPLAPVGPMNQLVVPAVDGDRARARLPVSGS
jgi:hypothetical protein